MLRVLDEGTRVDVDRVTACMIAKQSQLSDGCRSVFRPMGATPTQVNYPATGKPHQPLDIVGVVIGTLGMGGAVLAGFTLTIASGGLFNASGAALLVSNSTGSGGGSIRSIRASKLTTHPVLSRAVAYAPT